MFKNNSAPPKSLVAALLKGASVAAIGLLSTAVITTQPTIVVAQEQQIMEPPSADILPFDRGFTLEKNLLLKSGRSYRDRSPTGEVAWETEINYVDAEIFNPRTGLNDKVSLRAYSHDGFSNTAAFVAPTINIWPGETLRVSLDNQLPANDPSCVKFIM